MWLAWIRTGPDGDAIRRVKDHLEDEALLIAIGGRADLVGDRGHPSDRYSRIEGLGKAARDDGILMRYLDQLGVVVKSSGAAGVIRLRHDAYQGATELDPNPSGPEPYFSARGLGSTMPAAGQVVKVADVMQGDLVVTAVSVRGGDKSVASAEVGEGERIVAANRRAR